MITPITGKYRESVNCIKIFNRVTWLQLTRRRRMRRHLSRWKNVIFKKLKGILSNKFMYLHNPWIFSLKYKFYKIKYKRILLQKSVAKIRFNNILLLKISLKVYFIRFLLNFVVLQFLKERAGHIYIFKRYKFRKIFNLTHIFDSYNDYITNIRKWRMEGSRVKINFLLTFRNMFSVVAKHHVIYSTSSGVDKLFRRKRQHYAYLKENIRQLLKRSFLYLTKPTILKISGTSRKIIWILRIFWKLIYIARRHFLKRFSRFKPIYYKSALMVKSLTFNNKISYGYLKRKTLSTKKKSHRRYKKYLNKMRSNLNFLSLYIFIFSKFNFYYATNQKTLTTFTFLQSKKTLKVTNLFLKYNSLFYNSILLELGTLDLLNRLLLFYIYYLPTYGFKCLNVAKTGYKTSIPSVSSFFLNAGWSERENSEMSGVYYTEKNDNRHLLLDYSFLGNPILKSFPVFGYFELIYDGNNNQVIYKKINFSNSEPMGLNYDII